MEEIKESKLIDCIRIFKNITNDELVIESADFEIGTHTLTKCYYSKEDDCWYLDKKYIAGLA
jgi:hypothetical protein